MDAPPALEIYDGPNFRILRKFLREKGWPPGLIIKIISAEHKIIDATKPIEPYDEAIGQRNIAKNEAERKETSKEIIWKNSGCPESVFINMGKDYLSCSLPQH